MSPLCVAVEWGVQRMARLIDAVPLPELIELRDRLNEDGLITMRGLRNLNMLIAKYEGGTEK